MNNKKVSPRKKTKKKTDTGPVISEPGEQVFSRNTDEILAGKIVDHAQHNTGTAAGHQPGPQPSDGQAAAPQQSHNPKSIIMRILALAGIGAAVLLIGARALAKGKPRNKPRSRR